VGIVKVDAIHAILQAEFSANAEKAARATTKLPVIQEEFQVALNMQPFKPGTGEQTNVTLRIEKDSDGQTTTLRLIGRMRREHIEELKAQIKAGGVSVALDLNEVSLVDLDVWSRTRHPHSRYNSVR
jgi:hypothetical protein